MKNLSIRPLIEQDYNFIISSWLKSNYAGMIGWKPNREEYFKAHQLLIKKALKDDATLVACPSDDESLIVGWCNFGHDYLNYVFIKQTFEGLGIASALLTQTGIDQNRFVVTHYTQLFNQRRSRDLEVIYNPYLFFKQEELYENQVC